MNYNNLIILLIIYVRNQIHFKNEVRFKYILNIGLEIIIQHITKIFKNRHIII